ncbi:vWFA domain containing protein [uncultured Caudovirales phage]|uniref:VWFA domain containing protein n=1 Tax=uncultured Caudovirales phage TaxID=2100421 RepID=A0A6J5KSR1_9CAUD|nr:vWFA domain containing protein [uncultured Caudovirales phage]
MTTTITTVTLTPPQQRAWTETRSLLLWSCPAFTSILYSMLNPEKGSLAATFTKDVPIAATDGNHLILNPDTFFPIPLKKRVFVVAHEIMHCILNHCALMRQFQVSGKVKYPDGSSLPYEQETMNMAMDYVINDLLIQSGVGEFYEEGLHDPNIAVGKDSFVDAYKKVYKKKDGKGAGSSQGKGQGKGFDILLAPGTVQGKDPGKAQSDRSEAEWNTAVAAAVASAKAQGKLPSALERFLGEVLEPEIAWQEKIRAFFARKVGGGSFDWRRPDRRLIQRDIVAPSRSGHGAGDVVVAVDTSGSIGQRELDVFFAEMRGILDDVRPMRMFVVWCDAKVHKVDELDSSDDVRGLKPAGGGGTAFTPVFDWIDSEGLQPDALVYLTDGMGSFPSRAPSYPVLWGDILGIVKYPFGDVVSIPLKKK